MLGTDFASFPVERRSHVGMELMSSLALTLFQPKESNLTGGSHVVFCDDSSGGRESMYVNLSEVQLIHHDRLGPTDQDRTDIRATVGGWTRATLEAVATMLCLRTLQARKTVTRRKARSVGGFWIASSFREFEPSGSLARIGSRPSRYHARRFLALVFTIQCGIDCRFQSTRHCQRSTLCEGNACEDSHARE